MIDDRTSLADALDELRHVLSVRGQSSVLAWTLLYAVKSHLAGRDCLGYRGTQGTESLLADVSDFMGRARIAVPLVAAA